LVENPYKRERKFRTRGNPKRRAHHAKHGIYISSKKATRRDMERG